MSVTVILCVSHHTWGTDDLLLASETGRRIFFPEWILPRVSPQPSLDAIGDFELIIFR